MTAFTDALRQGLAERAPLRGEFYAAVYVGPDGEVPHLATASYTEQGARDAADELERYRRAWCEHNHRVGIRRFTFEEQR